MTVIFLTTDKHETRLRSQAAEHGLACVVVSTLEALVETAASLEAAASGRTTRAVLISYDSDVRIPAATIRQLKGRVFRIHLAGPDYPGEAPYQFSALDRADTCAATLHAVTEAEVYGPIISVLSEPIAADAGPKARRDVALERGLECLGGFLEKLEDGLPSLQSPHQWSGTPTTPADVQSLCRVSALDPEEEIDRRVHAASMDGEDPVYLDINGHRFAHAGAVPYTEQHRRDEAQWGQFTEAAYRELLEMTRETYSFATYKSGREGRHVLWRHDLDHSIQQARALAEIEADVGVVATYMFTLRLPYYNLLEHKTQTIAREILAMGHRPGLHFDVAAYEKEDWTEAEIEAVMARERDLLSECLDMEVEAVSYHDPTCGDLLRFDKDIMAGMVNGYGKTMKSDYEYCSDSNGYWRHRPIPDVIASGEFDRIQVLTHPEWWTPTPLPPRQRIERTLLKGAQEVMQVYDAHLANAGRKNIR